MEEKIIRPTTKPEAIKGKLLKYQGTDYCEFLPQSQGEPQYEGISKTRNSQLKRSKGKNPKLVAHLTAKADSMDPYADMQEELEHLFPDKENATPKPRGRRLMAESEIEVRLNSEQRQVESLHTVLKVLNRVFPKATVKVMRNNALEQDVKSWFAEVPASD